MLEVGYPFISRLNHRVELGGSRDVTESGVHFTAVDVTHPSCHKHVVVPPEPSVLQELAVDAQREEEARYGDEKPHHHGHFAAFGFP